MTLTILFDLDDTLLITNMADFIPAYFAALGQALVDLGSTKQIAQQIHFAIDCMETNRDPAMGLREIFSQKFYPALNTSEAAQQETLEEFYSKAYPKLQGVTDQIPEVRSLIDWCKAQGHQLAVATNPLFPTTATRQRMDWAGLAPADFEFFSTFENFHFTKPNLSYYCECLGRLGWPEGPIAMIGDSLSLDLLPMEELGFSTFWINPPKTHPDHPHGSIRDVQSWLSDLADSDSTTLRDTFEINYAILQSTPAVFDSWIKENPAPAFHLKPSPDEWDLTEVYWHVADMEAEVYLPQWQQILDDHTVLLTAPDTSQWAAERQYKTRSISEAWEKFVAARKQSLAFIEEIKRKGLLDTTTQHTIFSHAAVSELVSFTAKHDRIHLHQCKALFDFYKIY